MNIVFIHGRDQAGEIPHELQAVWEKAWERGLTRAGLTRPAEVTIHFPFYGDLLADLVGRFKAKEASEVPVYRSNVPTLSQFQDQLLEEIARASFREDEIQAAKAEAPVQVRTTGAIRSSTHGTTRSIQNWPIIRGLANLLDRTPLGASALERITHDVFLYLTDDAIRQEVNKHVIGNLPTEPCVVVGHSLGSVLGYHLLRESAIRASRFITLGSPLAMLAITKLHGAATKPDGLVGHWLNAYDPRDVVALRRLAPPEFTIDPAVINKGDVDNFTANRHSIPGYLEDPEVARWIHAGLA